MTIADQVLSYLKVLVWPVIVTVALVLFRGPIGEVLRGLEEIEGFGFKAKIRRRVIQAARNSEEALAGSPIKHIRDISSGRLYVIARYMQTALRFSPDLVPSSGRPPAGRLGPMRRAVEQLEAAIIAVLVVTVLPESNEPRRVDWSNMTPAGIEIYMVDITGFTGWRGVIETRDTLRDTLSLLCGKRGEAAVTFVEMDLFITAARRAFEHLNDLVSAVVEAVPG